MLSVIINIKGQHMYMYIFGQKRDNFKKKQNLEDVKKEATKIFHTFQSTVMLCF